MVSARTFLLLPSLCAMITAVSAECRCGSSEFLTFPRVNLTSDQEHPCAAYKLLDARGTQEPQGVSLMFQTSISRALANRSSLAVSQSILYPAAPDQNVTAGVAYTLDLIKYGLRDCPAQKYFLFGYSQGATVMLEALGKMDNASAAAVASVVLVGNPYRMPGRRSNVDYEGAPDNRTAVGMFATQVLAANGTVIPKVSDEWDWSGKVKDICLQDDIVCAFDSKCQCQLSSDHLSYGLMEPVQDLIFEHVVSMM
ncbi:Family 5 carbohydrate esterase protein [Rutstroemia sp. NJR-2017a WRK4]|nr:Family 5 carbohydrate esterase protein [Rutstroemia sp. NJR-2017a WRK4]